MGRRVTHPVKSIAASLLLGVAATASMTTAPAHAFPFGGGIVLDPSNLAQNILTATRTLQQVNNQIRQLQNEAQMLINDAKNLVQTAYDPTAEINKILGEIDTLINTAKAIQYTIADTDRIFKAHFPEDYSSWSEAQMQTNGELQWKVSRNAFHDALLVQSGIIEGIAKDRTTLNRLLTETKSAQGALAVAQTGNQLLAVDVQQSMQMQQLMAAQYRADALERARRLQIERESKVRTARFVGANTAY